MKWVMIATMVFSSSLAFAGQEGSGGDICENRFKTVGDDVRSWILQGGASGLKLPAGVTLNNYNLSMLNLIGNSKISCTSDPVLVGGAEKTCKNFIDSSHEAWIVCNYSRFLAASESDQYVLVHHEYAGLAGFEASLGSSSTYVISNQITGYLEDTLVKRLAVKPDAPMHCQPLTLKTGAQMMPPGSHEAEVGTFKLSSRVRLVDEVTGIGPWGEWSDTNKGTISLITVHGSEGGPALEMKFQGTPYSDWGHSGVTARASWFLNEGGIKGPSVSLFDWIYGEIQFVIGATEPNICRFNATSQLKGDKRTQTQYSLDVTFTNR